MTPRSDVSWSADGQIVTKRLTDPDLPYSILGSAERAFRNERNVNRLLLQAPPPVPTPRLVGCDRRGRRMDFEAVDGQPLGPKFPLALDRREVGDLVILAQRLGGYRPRRRWFRRLDVRRRLSRHVAVGLISEEDAHLVCGAAVGLRWRFGHGDITARNVIRASDGRLVLIDWEWAGWYPAGYDLAFLWFTLIDVPGARDTARSYVPSHLQKSFLVSAILVNLLHLHIWTEMDRQSDTRPNHEATLATLLKDLGQG